MIEVWKDIPNYEGKYQISSLGRLRNNKIIMKPMLARNGYLIACLWKNNRQKKIVIHRLVAKAFLPNPNNYKEVNHIDEDKTNNIFNNLEWCSHKYNMNYGKIKEKISIANKGRKASLQTKNKISKNSINRIWINNGKVEKFIKKYDISQYENWNCGRVKREVV